MSMKIIISSGMVFSLLLIMGVGCANKVQKNTPPITKDSTSITKKVNTTTSNVTTEKKSSMTATKDSMTATKDSMETTKDKPVSFSGTVLGGDKAKVLDFNKSDYDKAIKSDKLVVLYFYASWCPLCRKEFPVMTSAFTSIDSDRVVGFRINFNDSSTDNNEKDLARQYGVAYQHTKVFVKDGKQILKSPATWDKDRYSKEINKYLK